MPKKLFLIPVKVLIFLSLQIFPGQILNAHSFPYINISNFVPPNLKLKTLQVDGIQREFWVYTPTNYKPRLQNKVVFMFHGTGQNGFKMFTNTGWGQKADAENFLVVFPNSLSYYLVDEAAFKTRWNDGNLQLKKQIKPARDVLFFNKMLVWVKHYTDSILNEVPSKLLKIYISGFSNGAMFCSRLTMDAADKITAAAVVSTALPKATLLQPAQPVPTLIIYGTKDQRIIDTLKNYTNVYPTNPTGFAANIFLQSIISWHLNRNQLANNFIGLINGNDYKLIYNTPNSSRADDRKYFEIQVYKGLQHKYPFNNTTPQSLNATDVFWEFFSKY